jgi:hypothetical protein
MEPNELVTAEVLAATITKPEKAEKRLSSRRSQWLREQERLESGKKLASSFGSYSEMIKNPSLSVKEQVAAGELTRSNIVARLGVSKAEIREMKTYPTPPPMVRRVWELVMLTLGEVEPDTKLEWKMVQRRIDLVSTSQQDSIFQRLKLFDPTTVDEIEFNAKYEAVKAILDDIPKDMARKSSEACRLLLEWVQVTYQMRRTACQAAAHS